MRIPKVGSTFLVVLFWQCAGGWVISAPHFSTRVWQVKDGLPQNQVRAILQSRDGYIWVATNDGLARFDGTRFTVFNRENTPALRSNIFTGLHEDRAGNLWISSDGGLIRYCQGQFASLTTADGLLSDYVGKVTEAQDGTLYIVAGNSLQLLRDGKIGPALDLNLPPRTTIRQVRVTRSGEVWLATGGGAVQIRGSLVRHYTGRDGLISENLNAVLEDRQGNLWFGSVGKGLIQWREGKFVTWPIKQEGPGNIVYGLAEDDAGRIWAGTHGGLYRWDGAGLTGLTRKEGLSSDFVTTLSVDREGNLWVGTDGGGLIRVRDAGVRVFSSRDGLAGDSVRSIVEDERKGIWIASWFSDHLNLYRDGMFQAVGKGEPLLKNGVRAMLVDRQGTLWLAVAANRLVSLRNGQFIDHSMSEEGLLSPIFALAEDEKGRLWLGRSDGLALYENGKTVNRTADLGLPAPGVRVIVRSRAGGLWVGTESGVLRVRDDGIQLYAQREGLPYPFVSGLYEDRDGVLWVGTRGGGLSRLRNDRFTNFTMRDGLPSDAVYQMIEDDQGDLWCGSSRGIFRVNRGELNQVAEGKGRRLNSVLYGHTEDMLTSVHFGTHPSACRTRDGMLWFPTISGIVVIEPEKLRLNTIPPAVAIELLSIDKQYFDIRSGIIAPPGRGEVEIQYTGLSFIAPERVSFRYRLEGFKQEWVEAGARRTAWYTNLPPGDYTFRVIAGNNDGVWSETDATIRFTLRHHFYETWWFYTACALLVGGLGWLVHRQRVRQMQARHAVVMAERNRIAREIHDTLAQEVAGLLAQLHVIKTLLPISAASAAKHLDRAVELARTGMADARRLVLDLRHQALENDDLAAAVGNFLDQLATGDRPRINYQVKGAPRRLAGDQENNLLRIGQESVANAVRHSGAEAIDVSLVFEPRQVELRVRDNGRGFDVEAASQGHGGHYGLLGIRERAAQIGGELTLSSSPGQGTEVKVRVRTS